MLSPVREESQNLFSWKLLGPSKRPAGDSDSIAALHIQTVCAAIDSIRIERGITAAVVPGSHSQRKPLAKSRSEKRAPLNMETARNSLSQWPTRAIAVANPRELQRNWV